MKNIDIMGWGKCENLFVKSCFVDIERIESIKEKALQRFNRAKKEKEILSFKVEDYYEAIKELLAAYLLKNGLKSKNHQCLISFFLKKNPSYLYESNIIAQMSYFRNRLNYYGENVPIEFYNKNKNEFEEIFNLIFQLF